jgi:hypothetical protein
MISGCERLDDDTGGTKSTVVYASTILPPNTPSGICVKEPPPTQMTSVTSYAHTVADTLRAAFGEVQLGGMTVEMTVPQQSTNGGVLVLQHVVLRSPAGWSLVVGTVNVVEKYAELRSFAHLQRAYEQRFRSRLRFPELAYRALVERATQVFGNFALETRCTDPPLEATDRPRAELARALFYIACGVMLSTSIVALLRSI